MNPERFDSQPPPPPLAHAVGRLDLGPPTLRKLDPDSVRRHPPALTLDPKDVRRHPCPILCCHHPALTLDPTAARSSRDLPVISPAAALMKQLVKLP